MSLEEQTDLRERERSRSTHSHHNRTRRHTPDGAHAHKWRAHTTTPTELGPGYHALSARRASKRESSSSGRAGVGDVSCTQTRREGPQFGSPPHTRASTRTHKHTSTKSARAPPPADQAANAQPAVPRRSPAPRATPARFGTGPWGGRQSSSRSPPRCSRSNMLSRSSRSGVHDPLLRRSPGGPCRGRSARRQGREPGVEPQRATPRRRGQVVRCGRQVFLGHP